MKRRNRPDLPTGMVKNLQSGSLRHARLCYNALIPSRAHLPQREVFVMAHTTTREQKTRMLCTAGLMAALACVSNFSSCS